MYTNPKYINDLGGILALSGEGVETYLAPGSEANALAQAGAFGVVTPLPVSAPAPLYASVRAAQLEAVRWIDTFLAGIVGNVPADEKLAWPQKEAAAQAVADGVASPAQEALIADEALITGETLADLADLILTKATIFRAVVSRVSGLRRKIEAALEAEPDPFKYEQILEDGRAVALAMAVELGLADPPS